jgi:hypothetical protein
MRSPTICLTVLLLFASGTRSSVPAGTPSGGEAYHIVLPRRAIGAGEQVERTLVPPAPLDVRVNWPVASSGSGVRFYSTVYRAPYVIPVGTPPAKVSVGVSGQGWRTIVSTEIELLPGSVPGAEGCLGPGQSSSTTAGTIVPDHTSADELPQLIHPVPPEYPKRDLARGIEDTIPVHALLCRTGHVLDAHALPSYVNVGDRQPIPHDPKLVEAAITAVRQYVFTPAKVSGQAIATWIDIPVAFRR